MVSSTIWDNEALMHMYIPEMRRRQTPFERCMYNFYLCAIWLSLFIVFAVVVWLVFILD
jgi:hypothetical protein